MYSQNGHRISKTELLISGFLLFLIPFAAFAGVEFWALLPNPAGDDTLGEYIEIRNAGCQTADISGYHLYDASLKTYTIPMNTTIASHSNSRFIYATTKIVLNNTGYESVMLTDRSGAIIDTDSYSGTQRDDVVIYLPVTDMDCTIPVATGSINIGVTNIGITNTGIMSTGVINSLTTNTDSTTTGSTVSGSTSTGITIIGPTNTGTNSTGSSVTGVIYASITFPEIIPTRQEPTNATLSDSIWDCGVSQPCRINVTFDPIFTGSFLSRNYICEVITATGILTTCNPNTLYFYTGSSFLLRLTSKLDPSQSRMMSWDVRFTIPQDNSGSTSAGSQMSGSSPISTTPTTNTLTGTIETSTGTTASGNIESVVPPMLVGSSTGTVDTSIVSTGSTFPTVADSGTLLTDLGVIASPVIQSDIVSISSGSLSVPGTTSGVIVMTTTGVGALYVAITNPGTIETPMAIVDVITPIPAPIDPPVSDTQIVTIISIDTGALTPLASSLTGGLNTMGTGMTNTGIISVHTGITSTWTTATGVTYTGTTATGILFPEILATRQEPTNAIFTGGVWDCGLHQPCRINVTFDPIFTGGLLTKNYICEVITATGILTTCNPSTLYFSTDSYFSFRLKSKVDPSQSRTVSWSVRFTVPQNNTSISTDIENLIGEINTGIINTHTGTTNSGILQDPSTLALQDSNTGVTFPQIDPIYQNYTNTTNSGNILKCVTSPCRVNFTLDPIFSGSFLPKNYTCEIRYGTGVYDSCNPPQLYLIGTGSIEITLTHRASGKKETKALEIIQNISLPIPAIHDTTVTPDQPSPLAIIEPDTIPPVVIIEFDGKMQSYYEQIGDYEFNCYALTCSINLTADRSYDPGGGKIRWLWYYGHNDIKTTRDPGGRKYGLGDHEIWLRVVDLAGNMSEIRYRIHVLGPIDKEEIIKVKKIKDPSLRGSKQSSTTKKKKKKPKKMDFFDPPTITLQKSKFAETDDGYLCRTTTKTCSLNLTLSGAEKGILYTWTYDDGDTLTSKNPKSQSLSLGSHTITITATYSGSAEALWTQTMFATVEKIIKAKKPRKIKTKKPRIATKKETQGVSIIVPEAAQAPEDDIPYTTMALIGGILPVLLLRRLLMGMV